MRIPKSLISFAGTERDETATFAFYIAIKQRSHKGSIHNYKSFLPVLCKKMNISESQFRILKNECIEKGFLWESGKHIFIKAPKKIFNELKIQYPQCFENRGVMRCFFTQLSDYKKIKYWIKGSILYNLGKQQEYNKLSKVERKHQAYNKKSAFNDIALRISRRKISYNLNYKSKSSATYLIKKLSKLKLIDNDERFSTKVREMAWIEYKLYFINNGQFFYKNGFLYKNECNIITFSNKPYFEKELSVLKMVQEIKL